MSYTQARRNLQLTTPLGDNKLLIAGLSGVEGISRLFEFQLEILSEHHDIDFDAVVGKTMTVQLRTAKGERYFHGTVRSFVQDEAGGGLARYRAQLVPWLWLLGRRRDCRIFQDLKVPDILKKLFGELGFSDHRFALEGKYEARAYCVQYRESDLDFVLRLMEEEGIWFFFEHGKNSHVLVLADSPAAHKACPGQAQIEYRPTPSGQMKEDHLFHLTREQHVRSAAVRLTDYNFETPLLDLAAQKQAEHGEKKWELYDYPGKYPDPGQGTRYAQLRMEAESATRIVFNCSSTCRALLSGYTIGVQAHPRGSFNASYLVTTVQHRASEGSGLGTEGDGGESSYQNAFEAVPSGTPLRPPRRTPRPIVEGPQTAVVVGPKGEEIYTDKYGRVKVQFPWDREGKKDEKSSCWIRVSQGWAGKNWGAIALPRIGQEVIVDFLEGDPDRPIITGRVYHAESMPPYELPAEQTKSTVKSRSSKGGGPANFNEIRFEDKKGAEEVYIHAEKDKKVEVENDRKEEVGHDETIHIGHDRAETVDHDERITVQNNRAEIVGVNETVGIGANRSLTVGGINTETVKKASAETIGLGKALTIGLGYQVSVGAEMNETVAGAQSTEIGGFRYEKVIGYKKTDVGEKITVNSDEEIVLKTGQSQISMKKDGTIEISGTDVTMKTPAGTVHIDAGGIITIKGSMVRINT